MNNMMIPMFAEVLNAYYDLDEFVQIASIFDVNLERDEYASENQQWLTIARHLIEKLEHGNIRLLVGQVLEQLDIRNTSAIAKTDWERRSANEALRPHIAQLRDAFVEGGGIQHEIVVADEKPFLAKSEIREFLAKSETEVFIVDPYIGVGTLDCLREMALPIRLLTGTLPGSVEAGFEAAVRAFRGEGFRVEIRRHAKLHDRHIVFNERCWLAGSSLKDAGKKAFHALEIIDAKDEVIANLEGKWLAGTSLP